MHHVTYLYHGGAAWSLPSNTDGRVLRSDGRDGAQGDPYCDDRALLPKISEKGGRNPFPLATMLTIHLIQRLYSLRDSAIDETLIKVPSMRSV